MTKCAHAHGEARPSSPRRPFPRRTALTWAGLALAAALLPGRGETAPHSTWAYSGKTAIGSAYEAYADGRFSDLSATGPVSKVWFSASGSVVTEVMYGLIHEAQIRRMRLAIRTADGVVEEGPETTVSRTYFLRTDGSGRPLSPAYRIVARDKRGRFEIEKRIFTDPDRQSLFVRVTVRALKGPVTPLLLLEPHMANTGGGDRGEAAPGALSAADGEVHLTLEPSKPFVRAGATPLSSLPAVVAGAPGWAQRSVPASADPILLSGEWPAVAAGRAATYDVAVGFGSSAAASAAEAADSLKTGYREVLARYDGEGVRVGWEDYLASLRDLPRLRAATLDGGRLLQASALMLKVQEDHTYPGALIASLSNPWGDTTSADTPATGYKAVWPRDLYQCAMALAALGDRQTPLAAFHHLAMVQVGPQTPGNHGAGGWFIQKSRVDGAPEWTSVQLDQTAFPIMLGYRLWRLGWLAKADLDRAWPAMVKPAADFLVSGGEVALGDNRAAIHPPFTEQERWEEQPGYSPSTMAAVVAGLVSAAEIAEAEEDTASAERYRRTADADSALVDARTFTTNGAFGNGRYYLRISPTDDPNDHAPIASRNGQPEVPKDQVLDAGFLELVRYGIRRADDPRILASLKVVDREDGDPKARIHYSFRFPGVGYPIDGWRRYGFDGYGEHAQTGANYAAGGVMHPGQRGRVWPIFTGERGHYELALSLLSHKGAAADIARIRRRYVHGMELFANDGGMLSEQVWDGVGAPTPRRERPGQGTDSATPLAWAHAEYIKLVRSVSDDALWDGDAAAQRRYGTARPYLRAAAPARQ